jgi:phosphoglycolate phosphatase
MVMSGSTVKAVIFDMDQTLLDSIERFFAAFNGTLEAFEGRPLGWDEFLESYRRDLLHHHIPIDVEAHVFWDHFLRNYDHYDVESRIIKGACETLRALKSRGFRVIVVTGRMSSRSVVEEELGKLGLFP